MPFPIERFSDLNVAVPSAEKKPHKLSQFNDTRTDEYYWLRSDARDDPEVLEYLCKENAYTKACLEDPTEVLRATLYDDMKSRIKEDDRQPAFREDDWYYYTRTVEGQQYSIHCRRPVPSARAGLPPTIHDTVDTNEVEQILIDENVRAASLQYYRMNACEQSPNHNTLAIAEDTTGAEKYTVRFFDLSDGGATPLPQHIIENCSGDIAWATDTILFYLTKDALDRPDRLWRYDLSAAHPESMDVFHETDDQHYLSLSRAHSEQYIYLSSDSALTSEVMYIPVNDPTAAVQIILPRKSGHEYSVEDRAGIFYLLSNDGALNNKVQCAPVTDTSTWMDILPHREDVKIERLTPFRDHLVVTVRQNGLRQLVVYNVSADLREDHLSHAHPVSFDEPSYAINGAHGRYKHTIVRFSYSSMRTPRTVFDMDLTTGERAVKKVQEVPGYDKSLYKTDRVWATAGDGVKVPISLVYKPSAVKEGPNPMYLEAYGAYEACCEATFSSPFVSLLDRGVIFAIAHVRGGGEMGRMWYEDGKFLKKHNTWRDYLACLNHLIDTKVTAKGVVVAEGCSAGGLLIGAMLNEVDEGVLAGCISRVGFVDVLTTMCDPTIPLTCTEWEEWGNCYEDIEYYKYMKGYSPYDNIVQGKQYPPILSTAGLNDNRVGYWEPCKWVQRLRDADKNKGINILYRCLMESGHFAKSGRFQMLEEKALLFAFVLECLKIA